MTNQSIITRFFLIVLLCFSAAWQSMVFAADGNAVNINTATAVEIADALKGVGLKRAEAIVEYRKEHGEFQDVESLLEVKGVGEKTLNQNKEAIIL